MSFPLPSGPYQGLFNPEPLNELPGLPLPNMARVPTAIQSPSAPMSSMPSGPGSPNKPDWATILSLVLPAVIAAMKGGGAAPLGAFYQSFAQAKDVGQMREMEQEEMIQKRKTEALRKEETGLNFIGQATKELIGATDFNQFKQLRSLYLRMAQDRGLDASPIAKVQFPFPNSVRKEAIDWATKATTTYGDNPEAAEKAYGPINIISSSIKDESGTPLTFTKRQAFEWAQIPVDDRGRPITKEEKEPVPNTPDEQIEAWRSRAKALHSVGEHEKAKVLEDRADEMVRTIKETSAASARPATARDVTPNEALNATLRLRDRFVKETQAAQSVRTQYNLMRSSLAAVRRGDVAAGSQGILVTFQKILDPASVVRESEYARSASGLSLMNQIQGQWMKIQKGGAGVPISELETFVNLAGEFVANQNKFAQETKEQINSIAKQYGLTVEQITKDFQTTVPTAQPSRPPAVEKILKRIGR